MSTTERKRGVDIHCNGPKDYKERHATKSSYHMGPISLSAPLCIDYKDILYANKPVNMITVYAGLLRSCSRLDDISATIHNKCGGVRHIQDTIK